MAKKQRLIRHDLKVVDILPPSAVSVLGVESWHIHQGYRTR